MGSLHTQYLPYEKATLHEPVATDTVFSDTPAVDSGVKQAQIFVGRDTLVTDAYPMNRGKQFVNTPENIIRRR